MGAAEERENRASQWELGVMSRRTVLENVAALAERASRRSARLLGSTRMRRRRARGVRFALQGKIAGTPGRCAVRRTAFENVAALAECASRRSNVAALAECASRCSARLLGSTS